MLFEILSKPQKERRTTLTSGQYEKNLFSQLPYLRWWNVAHSPVELSHFSRYLGKRGKTRLKKARGGRLVQVEERGIKKK